MSVRNDSFQTFCLQLTHQRSIYKYRSSLCLNNRLCSVSSLARAGAFTTGLRLQKGSHNGNYMTENFPGNLAASCVGVGSQGCGWCVESVFHHPPPPLPPTPYPSPKAVILSLFLHKEGPFKVSLYL